MATMRNVGGVPDTYNVRAVGMSWILYCIWNGSNDTTVSVETGYLNKHYNINQKDEDT